MSIIYEFCINSLNTKECGCFSMVSKKMSEYDRLVNMVYFDIIFFNFTMNLECVYISTTPMYDLPV